MRTKPLYLGSKAFDTCNVLLMVALIGMMVYPFYYVFIASISDNTAIVKGQVTLLPKDVTLQAYRVIIKDKWLWVGYGNTLLYIIGQVIVTISVTSMAAYALSKGRIWGENIILKGIVFSMLFYGGLIPFFMVIKSLGMYNSPLVLIIPDAMHPFYFFIFRTFFKSLGNDLEDAARIDGCGYLGLFWWIVMPVSKAVFATIAMFIAVSQWNSFFRAMIFLTNKFFYPIQIHLRNIIITGSASVISKELGVAATEDGMLLLDNIRYATIILGILPIVILFPWVQKYFIKGALLGSVKG